MAKQPTKYGRRPKRAPVQSGRKTSQRFDAGWIQRLQAGNAAILHFHEMMKKRLQVAR